MDNLVFFDGECGLCDKTVQFLLKVDKKKEFQFAPLQGETAKFILRELPEEYVGEDSLVLVENYRSIEKRHFFVLGKAALRILWKVGGKWALIGWLQFLPSYLFDIIYRFIARHRKRFFSNTFCEIPKKVDKERFLP